MAAQLKIAERRIGDVVILDLHGRLEVGDGDIELVAFLDGVVARGVVKVVLNLRQVTYIDSRGIAVMVARHLSLRKRGGDLKLLNVTERTLRALAVTRLLTVFDTFTDEAEAIASYSRGPTALPAS